MLKPIIDREKMEWRRQGQYKKETKCVYHWDDEWCAIYGDGCLFFLLSAWWWMPWLARLPLSQAMKVTPSFISLKIGIILPLGPPFRYSYLPESLMSTHILVLSNMTSIIEINAYDKTSTLIDVLKHWTSIITHDIQMTKCKILEEQNGKTRKQKQKKEE